MTSIPAPRVTIDGLAIPEPATTGFAVELRDVDYDADHAVEHRDYVITLAGVPVATERLSVADRWSLYGPMSNERMEAALRERAMVHFADRLAYLLNPAAVPVMTLPDPEPPTWTDRHPNWTAVLIFLWLVGSGLALTYGWPW